MGCEFHIDCAEELQSDGSDFKDLESKEIEYASMINIRPKVGNRSMEIQIQEIKEKVEKIVKELLH
ncbi:MAG: hypothetical protein HY093_00715 [Candidatus Liptonbacteria bacterium]|nr:hypothetical protein [Candidatus Liptonbacteria bacterium]